MRKESSVHSVPSVWLEQMLDWLELERRELNRRQRRLLQARAEDDKLAHLIFFMIVQLLMKTFINVLYQLVTKFTICLCGTTIVLLTEEAKSPFSSACDSAVLSSSSDEYEEGTVTDSLLRPSTCQYNERGVTLSTWCTPTRRTCMMRLTVVSSLTLSAVGQVCSKTSPCKERTIVPHTIHHSWWTECTLYSNPNTLEDNLSSVVR